MSFLKTRLGALAAAALVIFGWNGLASASTFYDWMPDQGSSGSGFIEFDTSTQSPENFSGLDPVDFFFDFQAPGVPLVGVDDVLPIEPWAAVTGKITDGLLLQSADWFSSNSTLLSFSETSASCQAGIVDYDSGTIFNAGMWVLRHADVPEPSTLLLLLIGLTGLALLPRRTGTATES